MDDFLFAIEKLSVVPEDTLKVSSEFLSAFFLYFMLGWYCLLKINFSNLQLLLHSVDRFSFGLTFSLFTSLWLRLVLFLPLILKLNQCEGLKFSLPLTTNLKILITPAAFIPVIFQSVAEISSKSSMNAFQVISIAPSAILKLAWL